MTDWETSAEWNAWPPDEVASRLSGLTIPWCVVAGWALDVWRGFQTRSHDDTEIGIPRICFPAIRAHLSAYELFMVGNGLVDPLEPENQPPDDRHQIWVLDKSARSWRLDIFLEPGDETTWIFRRDESLRLPRREVMAVSGDGIPYLKPEVALLYKAKAARPKDTGDFLSALPIMDNKARNWLRDALLRVHPHHAGRGHGGRVDHFGLPILR
jgi:hypothetical protein